MFTFSFLGSLSSGTKSFLRQALLATTSQSFTRLRHSSTGLVTANNTNSTNSTLAPSGGRLGNPSSSQDADQPFANIDTSSIAGMDCLDIDLLVKNHHLPDAETNRASNPSGTHTFRFLGSLALFFSAFCGIKTFSSIFMFSSKIWMLNSNINNYFRKLS